MELRAPCPKCPFRTDIEPFLTAARAREIASGLAGGQATFACHQTTNHDDDGEHVYSPDEQHCAGALIMLEHMKRPSQYMRVCERIRCYDHRKLKMDAPVFRTAAAFARANDKRGRKKR